MKYRRLTSSDMDRVLEMNQTFREEFIDPAGVKAFLKDDKNWIFAALEKDRVIAFAYGYMLERLDAKRMMYIHEVGVAEEYQRQGVGTTLMEELKAAAAEDGCAKIFLITDQANEGANRLYQKTGGEMGVDSHGNDRMYWFPTSHT